MGRRYLTKEPELILIAILSSILIICFLIFSIAGVLLQLSSSTSVKTYADENIFYYYLTIVVFLDLVVLSILKLKTIIIRIKIKAGDKIYSTVTFIIMIAYMIIFQPFNCFDFNVIYWSIINIIGALFASVILVRIGTIDFAIKN
ncbi:MAG TPA: hypothetical protein QF753_21905 [Victivallales bacterium]|nr:hypothetical protein [Victivallales bacterium]